jgi:hypothetical protein
VTIGMPVPKCGVALDGSGGVGFPYVTAGGALSAENHRHFFLGGAGGVGYGGGGHINIHPVCP